MVEGMAMVNPGSQPQGSNVKIASTSSSKVINKRLPDIPKVRFKTSTIDSTRDGDTNFGTLDSSKDGLFVTFNNEMFFELISVDDLGESGRDNDIADQFIEVLETELILDQWQPMILMEVPSGLALLD